MTHAIERTNEKGVPFVGRCFKCGEEGLKMEAVSEPCPADDVVSDEAALLAFLK